MLKTSSIFVVLLVLLVSCKSKTVYVPVETIKTEIEFIDRIERDSTILYTEKSAKDSIVYKDSLVYVVDEQGKVLSKELYKWKDRYRENNHLLSQLQTRYDSLLQEKQSVQQKEVPVEVEVPTPYYPKWLVVLAIVGLLALLYLGYKLTSLFRH